MQEQNGKMGYKNKVLFGMQCWWHNEWGVFLAVALYFVSMVRDGSCSQQNFVQEGLSLSNCSENKTDKKPK